MKDLRVFLTEVLNPYLGKNRYFKANKLTLKKLFTIAVTLLAVCSLSAQGNIEFIENKGQWDERVRYMGDVSNGAFFIRNGGFTVLQHNPADMQRLSQFKHGLSADGKLASTPAPVTVRSHAWNVDFVGASSGVMIVPDKMIPTYNNYFIGDNPSKWASDCKIYQGITVKGIYPGIDLRYYTDRGTLKYDILVQPGADPSRIALKYDGVDKVQVRNKELVIGTSIAEFKESSP